MEKGNLIRRILRFARRKSFYIVLGLCAIAIGISGYILFFTDGGETQPDPALSVPKTQPTQRQPVSGQARDVTLPEVPEPDGEEEPEEKQQPKEPQPPTVTEEQPPAQTTVSQPQSPDTVEVSSPAPVTQPVFTFPVRGAQVQRSYSGAQLVFDETMGDWRTHNGTDFACDEGDEVMAVLDGSIERIYEDGMLGTCILLDHGAELKSLYCGLTAADGLREDQQISVGQTIGRACGRILGESAQSCHVHLEMWDGGQQIDPMSVLN